MNIVHPVLLAGGSGTRLWPLSRKSYPKQFSKLVGDKTLFQNSAQRLMSSDTLEFTDHITMTNAEFRFIIPEQLQEIGIDPGPILIEPEAKNTAAAILAASIFTHSKDQNAIIIVAPSDHVISDIDNFREAIKLGLWHVQNGKMVTFGINPTHPETGYGYLELAKDHSDPSGVSDLVKFVEKPNINEAKKMLAAGNFLWNAGIFLFRAQDMIDAFKAHAPETLDLVSQSVANAYKDLGFLRLAAKPWSMLEDISIDYAIMEKAHNLVAVRYTSKWSDLGGWDTVWSEGNPDSSGNVVSEAAQAIECTNSLLRSESSNQQVVGIGLDNIIAIAMPDAVLVASKDRAQDVKKAVNMLKDKEIVQATEFPKVYRPWGWYETISISDRYQVKRIQVKSGASLSLQSHHHRSEHWIVVNGTVEVTVNDKTKLISEGESIYIPLGAIHRMKNLGKIPMLLIEVQTGAYLNEDDIVRYQDEYGRV